MMIRGKDMCKQALYLEDDQLMRMAVKMEADKRQMDLKIFSNSKDFLTAADNVSKETILFLDSDIGEKHRGEEIGKICFEKGFKTIYLVTSFDKNYL